jgi:predicted GH43/DUF377 family glycosyl hydrolase
MFYRAVKVGNHSSIGYCQFKDGKLIYRSKEPIIKPEFEYEKHGTEDPRIIFLDGIYYLFYVAYDGTNARVALATSRDLKTFKKKGVITSQMTYDKVEDLFTQSKVKKIYTLFERLYRKNDDNILLWEKDTFIFPKKINGHFAMLHRVLPGIQITYFDSFSNLNKEYWTKYFRHMKKFIVIEPAYNFENFGIGGGCPPVETEAGWLLFYHAIEEHNSSKTYHAAVALLDKNNPTRIIGRLSYPLFSPTEDWEKDGTVNNVVFPTSAILKDGKIDIYYGAADSVIALKTIELSSLLTELISQNDKKE